MFRTLSGREVLARVRAEGCSARRGPIRVSFVANAAHGDDRAAQPTMAVAFSVPKRVGSAVVRNRVRRRLRPILRELATEHPTPVAAGHYLFGVHSSLAALSHRQLRTMIAELLQDLSRR